jgi:hypothetical protein
MADAEAGVLPAVARIAELAADPNASRWARDCEWIPGTGYCRRRPCGEEDCVFRAQRAAEAGRVVCLRQARRPTQRPLSGRLVRHISVTTGGRVGAVEA